MNRKITSILLVLALCAAVLSACGGRQEAKEAAAETAAEPQEPVEAARGTAEISAEAAVEAKTEPIDEQNPVMNYIGSYTWERCDIFVGCEGKRGASFTVRWGSSAWEHSEWTMTGEFDEKTRSVYYHDCEKVIVTTDDSGKTVSEEQVYTGGHGTITFLDDMRLTWEDDQEHMADGMVFEFWYPQQ